MDTNWYVAKSKPQKEAWLTTSLTSLGVEVFYPRIISNRRGKRTLEPLFPTYVFCKFEVETPEWPAIRWSPGLSYFLGTDGHPTAIPDEIVDYIKDRISWWNNEGSIAGFLDSIIDVAGASVSMLYVKITVILGEFLLILERR